MSSPPSRLPDTHNLTLNLIQQHLEITFQLLLTSLTSLRSREVDYLTCESTRSVECASEFRVNRFGRFERLQQRRRQQTSKTAACAQ